MNEPPESRPLNRKEIWRLIFATYRASFPYLLIFLLGLLVTTWVLTALVF